MAKLRINRGILKRLSIVLTVLFIAAFTVIASMKVNNDHYNLVSISYNFCIDTEVKQPKPNLDRCSQEMTNSFERWDGSIVWRDRFFVALAIAAFIWLLIGLTYAVTRWVLNGRSPDTEEREQA